MLNHSLKPCFTLPPALDLKNKKAIVIGAGIAGCSMAYSLANKGFTVSLIDKNETIASEASGNPVGLTYPQLGKILTEVIQFNLQAFYYTNNLLNKIAPKGWDNCGVLHLDIDDETAKKHQKFLKNLNLSEKTVKYVDKDEASHLSGVNIEQSALFFPMAGAIQPRELCKVLIESKRITLIKNTEIKKIEKHIDGIWSVYDEGGLECDNAPILILTNAMDVKETPYTDWLSFKWVKGQITYLNETLSSLKLKTALCHEGYMTPSYQNIHYAGASFEKIQQADCFEVEHDVNVQNIDILNKHIPSLGISNQESNYQGRVGYRIATADHLPVIGPCPDIDFFKQEYGYLRTTTKIYHERLPAKYIEGLYISTGFGSHGMTTAPYAAEFIANMIAGNKSPISEDITPYILPQRFIIRGLKRGKL